MGGSGKQAQTRSSLLAGVGPRVIVKSLTELLVDGGAQSNEEQRPQLARACALVGGPTPPERKGPPNRTEGSRGEKERGRARDSSGAATSSRGGGSSTDGSSS